MTRVPSLLLIAGCVLGESDAAHAQVVPNTGTTVQALGRLQPIEVIELSASVSAPIAQVMVEDGSQVKAGEVLAKLDSRTPQIKLIRARGGVEQTLANLQLAKAKFSQCERDYARLTKLVEAKAVDAASVDAARDAFESAKGAIQLAEAAVQISKADYELTQLELDSCTIRAPRDGVIMQRKCTAGAIATPSVPLFVLAANFSVLHLIATIPEADIGRVKAGQAVTFTVPAFPDARFEGRIHQIRFAPQHDAKQNGPYEVIVEVNNADRKLLPYLTAQVQIVVGTGN